MSKILTISIPTWNRAALLDELLSELTEAIKLFHLESKIQILVSNNNSTDETDNTVNKFKNIFTFISYNRNSTNIGGKSNVLLSMELAETPFVMFLGDDDRIRNSALLELVTLLESDPSIGLIIDISKYKFKHKLAEGFVSQQIFFESLYWYMGNASLFVCRTSFIKENLNIYGYNFFNECWPQTQLMILGLTKSNLKPFLTNLHLSEPSKHSEVMIYSSYYLWRTCVWDLYQSIEAIKSLIDNNIYEACRYQMKESIKQNFLNILQCGLFVDDMLIRNKTQNEIISTIEQFSFKEKSYLSIIILAFSLPIKFSRAISNIFIYLTKGRKGLNKKNSFVKVELAKKINHQTSNNKIRYLTFED